MIKFDGVSKRFGKTPAINDIRIAFDEGVYGLLGPNGSGKTTLMRCLVGALRPTSDQIERPESIGYLPQKFGMFKPLKVSESMAFFADLKEVPPA